MKEIGLIELSCDGTNITISHEVIDPKTGATVLHSHSYPKDSLKYEGKTKRHKSLSHRRSEEEI